MFLDVGHKQIFQMDIDPKHAAKLVRKWFMDNKVNVLEGHHKALIDIL